MQKLINLRESVISAVKLNIRKSAECKSKFKRRIGNNVKRMLCLHVLNILVNKNVHSGV